MSAIRIAAIAAAALLLGCPATAPGQVHVDPDGPAGKQYTAPLEQARQQASGSEGSAGVPGSSEVAPAFGVGIGPPGSGGDRGGGSASGEGPARGAAARAAPGDASTGLVAAAALLVLAIGAGAGFALRSASRRAPA